MKILHCTVSTNSEICLYGLALDTVFAIFNKWIVGAHCSVNPWLLEGSPCPHCALEGCSPMGLLCDGILAALLSSHLSCSQPGFLSLCFHLLTR